MLAKFAAYKGFLFLPNSFDTCPRTVIEAKLLGCELILNEGVQHRDEEWFNQDFSQIIEYLSSRTKVFWNKIYEVSNERIPQESENKQEKTRFKIIVPVHNSQNWVANTMDSVRFQKYSNYECIVCDDMSTDKTWDIVNSFEWGDKFTLHKNTERKFALKNIHDGINMLNPDPEDVIVVLDGDDWLPTEHVLSKLNDYYTNEKCSVTYGSFVRFPDGIIGPEASEYSQETIKGKKFREDQWRASHLKTFKHSLWDRVSIDDLKDSSGNFYEVSYDQAMMFPLLEMAGNIIA